MNVSINNMINKVNINDEYIDIVEKINLSKITRVIIPYQWGSQGKVTFCKSRSILNDSI